VPANRYEVYAALSHEEQKAGQMRGSLDRVMSGAGGPVQAVSRLGTFTAAGSGGWGRNVLVPLRNAQGGKVVVNLGGGVTLRYNGESGDVDYLVLAPLDLTPPRFTAVRRVNEQVMMEWTGGGVLLRGTSVRGPWVEVPGAESPYYLPKTGTGGFFRVRRD
jgi:hypothetical protein